MATTVAILKICFERLLLNRKANGFKLYLDIYVSQDLMVSARDYLNHLLEAMSISCIIFEWKAV